MIEDVKYYAIAILAIVIGITVLRKMAGCVVRIIVMLVLLAKLAALYYLYLQ